MITIDALRFRELDIDTLKIPPGITTIIGRNGSGKSTFLKLCAGIFVPEMGSVQIDGQSPRSTEIGYVNEFPDRNILFPLVKDELASSLRFRFTPCEVTDKAIKDCADQLDISHLLNRRMRELSGGEKILVALAAACICSPQVLILDECDSHLDVSKCAWLEGLLRTSGVKYILWCTQQMETATLGNHLLYMEKGNFVYTGSPQDVFLQLAKTSFYPLSWRCRE